MPRCAACDITLEPACFSKGQLRKGDAKRCAACIASASADKVGPVDEEGPSISPAALLPFELAGRVVFAVRQGIGVRTALYDKRLAVPPQLLSTVTAIVSEVLKHLEPLCAALAKVEGPWEAEAARCLAAVLTHEMVVRGRAVKGGAKHALARAVWERRLGLEGALALKRPALGEAKAAVLPRYVRVNVVKASLEEVLAALPSARPDPVIPYLLRLPPKTSLHGHALVEAGKIILQDRASCLPALALSPPPGATVVDACAAPGNKTTHLASMVGGLACRLGGTVLAFERNKRRADTLRFMLERAGTGGIVRVCEADFRTAAVDTPPFDRATHILVDPSCSGSGGAGGHTGGRQEGGHAADDGAQEEASREDAAYWDRIRSLAELQQALVLKALSFPRAVAVVYSTCSIHQVRGQALEMAEARSSATAACKCSPRRPLLPTQLENEDVVKAVLAAAPPGWRLARCLPQWPTRGLAQVAHGNLCVRAGEADETHGFFVARFERGGEGLAPPSRRGEHVHAAVALERGGEGLAPPSRRGEHLHAAVALERGGEGLAPPSPPDGSKLVQKRSRESQGVRTARGTVEPLRKKMNTKACAEAPRVRHGVAD